MDKNTPNSNFKTYKPKTCAKYKKSVNKKKGLPHGNPLTSM